MTRDEWAELMEGAFPVKSSTGQYELDYCGDVSEPGSFKAVIRLIAFDEDGALRDIKEQHVAAGSPDTSGGADRYATFLEAFAAVFQEIGAGALDDALPIDLFPVEVLEQKASNFDEFAKALAAKSRLGQFT